MKSITLQVEFYMKGREQAYVANMEVHLREEVEDDVSQIMDFALVWLLGEVDTVGAHRLVLEDEHHTKYVILIDEIQAISINAPISDFDWDPH